MQHVNIMASLFISASRPSSRLTKSTKEQKPGGDKMNNKVKRVCKRVGKRAQTRLLLMVNAFKTRSMVRLFLSGTVFSHLSQKMLATFRDSHSSNCMNPCMIFLTSFLVDINGYNDRILGIAWPV